MEHLKNPLVQALILAGIYFLLIKKPCNCGKTTPTTESAP